MTTELEYVDNIIGFFQSDGTVFYTPVKMNDVKAFIDNKKVECHFVGILYDEEVAPCEKCKFYREYSCINNFSDIVK